MADINEKDILLHQGEPAEAEPAIDAEQGKTDLSAAEALEHEGGLNTAAQSIPDTLPVLPVRDVVIFNYMILPLFIGRDKSVQAVDAALKTGRHLLVCAQKEESTEDPKPEDLYEVGTVVQVMRMLKMPDSRVKILVQGVSRARVTGYRQVEPFLEARIETLPEQIPVVDATVEALLRSVREQSEKVLTLRGLSSPDVLSVLQGVDDPGRLADLIAANMRMKTADAQRILEAENPIDRLMLVNTQLQREVEVATVQARIQLVKTQFLSCKADQSVLDDSILNASFTELLAELGIILYVDALVVDQYTCRRILDLLYQGSDQSLLLFQNLCVRHHFHLL